MTVMTAQEKADHTTDCDNARACLQADDCLGAITHANSARARVQAAGASDNQDEANEALSLLSSAVLKAHNL